MLAGERLDHVVVGARAQQLNDVRSDRRAVATITGTSDTERNIFNQSHRFITQLTWWNDHPFADVSEIGCGLPLRPPGKRTGSDEKGAEMATHTDQQPTAQLVSHLSEQVSVLVRDELTLARMEMVEKGKKAGKGAGLLGAAGVVALYGVGALLVTGGAALALVMPAWAAALVVAAVVFVIAGIAAVAGRQQVKSAMPAEPLQAMESGKQDVEAVKAAIRR